MKSKFKFQKLTGVIVIWVSIIFLCHIDIINNLPQANVFREPLGQTELVEVIVSLLNGTHDHLTNLTVVYDFNLKDYHLVFTSYSGTSSRERFSEDSSSFATHQASGKTLLLKALSSQ